MPSEEEGFGLPLIEAANFHLPILARDIPVFREVAGDAASYFKGLEPEALAQAVRHWLTAREAGAVPDSGALEHLSWDQHTRRVVALLTGEAPWSYRLDGDEAAFPQCVVRSAGELTYLEQVIDLEDGSEHGPLSGKELLVYSPAKTGTVSLSHSLMAALGLGAGGVDPSTRLLHSHSNEALARRIRQPAWLPEGFCGERRLVADLVRYRRLTGQHTRIVTSYRDPLLRLISNVFQFLEGAVVRYGRLTEDAIDFERCHAEFLRRIPKVLDEVHPLEEVLPDFFEAHTFSREEKCCYYREAGLEVLVLCLEHSDRWEPAIAQYLGLRDVKVGHLNRVEDKVLRAAHDDFVARLRMPEEQIRSFYYGEQRVHRLLEWFYTAEEIDGFCRRACERFGEGHANRLP
jgi:hypothetical protein